MFPFSFQCFAGGFYGNVDVVGVTLVNGYDGFLVVGVDGFEGSTCNAGDEFIVDEPDNLLAHAII